MREWGYLSKLNPLHTRLKLRPTVGTCFVGIPSDRILFPSERGDKTSFFQYMNSWSLTAYSVSKLGAWNQEKTRRWASELVSSVPCVDSGVSGAQLVLLHDNVTATDTESFKTTQRRRAAHRSAEKPDLEQKDFLPFPGSPLSTFGKEYDYRKRIKLRGWQLLLRGFVGGGRLQGYKVDEGATSRSRVPAELQ